MIFIHIGLKNLKFAHLLKKINETACIDRNFISLKRRADVFLLWGTIRGKINISVFFEQIMLSLFQQL